MPYGRNSNKMPHEGLAFGAAFQMNLVGTHLHACIGDSG